MDDSPTVVVDAKDVTLLRKVRAPSKPCLLLYSGEDAGQRFDLEPGHLIIGRVPGAQVRIEASGISRQHAELQVRPGKVVLQDLGSANGTLVNEERIVEPVELQDGDLIRLSNVVLRFHTRNNLDLLLRDRIYQQATVDPLTGAFNRRFLHDVMPQSFARARAAGRPPPPASRCARRGGAPGCSRRSGPLADCAGPGRVWFCFWFCLVCCVGRRVCVWMWTIDDVRCLVMVWCRW